MPKISLIVPTLAHQSQILSLAKAFEDNGLVLHGMSLSLFDSY